MNTIQQSVSFEEVIKKSRFIGIIDPCLSEQQAKSLLAQMHRLHPHASHVVYAYRILTEQGTVSRFHDAGEPSGTAGKPMLAQLEGHQLINVQILVVRYFGGIKLGTGGLTRAYAHTAKSVIKAASINAYVPFTEISLTLNYDQTEPLQYHLKKLDGTILEQDFTDVVRVKVKLPKKNAELLIKILQL